MSAPESTVVVSRSLLLAVAYDYLQLLELIGAPHDRALVQLLGVLGYQPDPDAKQRKAENEGEN